MEPPWTLPKRIFILHLCITILANNITYTVMFLELENQNLYTCSYGLWGISSWAFMGATNTSWITLHSLPLRMVSATFGYSLIMGLNETSTFLCPPPPSNLVPFHGLSWATKRKCHGKLCILHFIKASTCTHNQTLTVPLLDLEKKFQIYTVLALRGPPPAPPWRQPMKKDNIESPSPMDEFCQVWLKFKHEFWRSRWNSYFLHWTPSPTCSPSGATLGTVMNNFRKYLLTVHAKEPWFMATRMCIISLSFLPVEHSVNYF